MIANPPPGVVSAEELAAAVRDGLEARRYFRPLPPAAVPGPSDEAFPRLQFYRRPIDFPVPPSRFWGGWALRAGRRVAKALLAPWLDHQAAFNAAVVDHLHATQAYLRDTAHRLAAVQNEVVPAVHATNSRLSECLYELHRLAADVRGPGGDAVVGFGEVPPDDPPHVAEGLFVLTRIGRPPARVLVLGPGGLHALDLAGLGFRVVLHTASPTAPRHPDLRVVHAARGGALPFPAASFDWVVVTARDGDSWADADSPVWADVARVLTADGRAIGSWAGFAEVPAAVGPLRVTAASYARRAGHGWTFATEPAADAERTLWVAGK